MRGAAEDLVSNKNLDIASDILRACTHPIRMQLMAYIHNYKSINVNNIYVALNLEQSITSQHLKILRDADLVLTNRTGKFIFYSLNYKLLARVAASVQKHFAS